jgi:hypothetical protein
MFQYEIDDKNHIIFYQIFIKSMKKTKRSLNEVNRICYKAKFNN